MGWDSGLIGLFLHLTTGRAVDPAKAAEWSASEEGRRFLAASSDAWYDASVAFGTDPAAARAAADRTTAFYTGAPEPGAEPAPASAADRPEAPASTSLFRPAARSPENVAGGGQAGWRSPVGSRPLVIVRPALTASGALPAPRCAAVSA